jgi:hypothetical protein
MMVTDKSSHYRVTSDLVNTNGDGWAGMYLGTWPGLYYCFYLAMSASGTHYLAICIVKGAYQMLWCGINAVFRLHHPRGHLRSGFR